MVELLQCSFCGKKKEEALQLVAGPTKYICNKCTASCLQVIAQGAAIGKIVLYEPNAPTDCSFCGKPLAQVQRIAGLTESRICNECLAVCHHIFSMAAA